MKTENCQSLNSTNNRPREQDSCAKHNRRVPDFRNLLFSRQYFQARIAIKMAWPMVARKLPTKRTFPPRDARTCARRQPTVTSSQGTLRQAIVSWKAKKRLPTIISISSRVQGFATASTLMWNSLGSCWENWMPPACSNARISASITRNATTLATAWSLQVASCLERMLKGEM